MSRREDRSAESKRRHSRFDREPSPKRSRRDGKPENERPITDVELDRDRVDRDHKNRHRRLQDPLPLEVPLSHNSKVESGTGRKESENRADGHHGGSRHSNDPTKVPQSRKYFQHDDRDSVGQIGRNFSRRTDSDRGWWRDSRDQQNDATINKNPSSNTHQKDEKAKETGLDRNPPARKRPSFSEQKIPTDPEKANKAAANPNTPNPQNHSIDSGRRDERGHNYRHSERSHQDWGGNFSTRDRDRSIGGSRYRGGRDNNRFGGRQGYNRPSGGRVDKWKHDLYDEASKSPTPKNEEDQISKIEALLAS